MLLLSDLFKCGSATKVPKYNYMKIQAFLVILQKHGENVNFIDTKLHPSGGTLPYKLTVKVPFIAELLFQLIDIINLIIFRIDVSRNPTKIVGLE